MRISSSTMYEIGVARLNDLQSGLLNTQQQLSTGRRILTPADDPVAAARVHDLTQGQAINTQLAANRTHAKNALSLEESVLQSVTRLIQDVRTQTVAAGNGALDDTQRKFIATDLRRQLDELVGLANSRDGTGHYIFSGYQSTSPAFSRTASGVQYAGDQGQLMLQVGPALQMAIGDSGAAVFNHIPSAGVLTATAASTNGGNATVSKISVYDATAMPNPARTSYDIRFQVSGGVTTYRIDTVPVTNGTYTSGTPIRFDGLQLTVTDGAAPIADGDTFTVRPSRQQSLFATINDLIDVLEAPASSATGRANLSHGLDLANGNLDRALDSILAVRATVGSRLREIEALDDAGAQRDVQYAQALSQLQDLDYVKAISELQQKQVALQAAQKSFIQISGLSLFNML